jgi:predicted DNA-binding transcriptional regulator AlpA
MMTDTPTRHDPDTMLRTPQAADVCGLRPQTLHDWRCRGIGPTYYHLGRRAIRYRAGDLYQWLEDQRVDTLD